MKEEIIKSLILEPGGKFIVTEDSKDSTYTPGSCGFMLSLAGVDGTYQNVARIEAVITRRGKGGKARIEHASLTTPVLLPDFSKKEFEKNFAKLMPDEKKKYHVITARALDSCVNVADMEPLDFLGYGSAMVQHLRKMAGRCKHSRWPEEKANPLNVMNRVFDRFSESPEDYLNDVGESLDFRSNFVAEMRRMLSGMARIHLILEKERAQTEAHAADFLKYVNSGDYLSDDPEETKNEYVFTEEKDLLPRTLEFYNTAHEKISELIKKLGQKG